MSARQSQWIHDLLARYDGLFAHEHPYELDCGYGWQPIVERLVQQLAGLKLQGFKVAQIKQKFGELRCYTSGHEGNTDVISILKQAREMAAHTCERCGFPRGHVLCQQYVRGQAREVFDAFGSTGFLVDEHGNLRCNRPSLRLSADPNDWPSDLPHAEFCAKPGDWIHQMPDGTLRLASWRG